MADGTTVSVTRETLEATPPRVMVFLRGIARKAAIRARMQRYGYGQEVHDVGFALLRAVSAYVPTTYDNAEDVAVRFAMAELNRVDEDILQVCTVALRHSFPDVHETLLAGLAASREESEAVVTMGILMQRLRSLESSGTQEEKQAIERLAARGIDFERRKRVEALIDTAQRVHQVEVADEAAVKAADEQYVDDLRKLRAWYEEWSGIARVAVKRRDHLILLGLAHRRVAETSEGEGDVEDLGGLATE